jgi:pimeloyl-ACP methyl ester carboxylesterase
MFGYDPLVTLPAVRAPVVALAAADDDARSRAKALAAASGARDAAGLGRIRAIAFPHDGHNLMRYRPDAVSAAILSVAGETQR